VVVVGAVAAGSAAAAAVRRSAPAVDVVVVGAEEWGPYNRTTVNKGLLSGAVDDAGIALPGMDRIGIDWRTGTVARSLDARARIVELSDGSRLAGDAIVLATGAEARALPGPIEDGARERVLTLRTAVDAARLRALIAAGRGRADRHRDRRRPPRGRLRRDPAAVTERAILGGVGDPRFALALLDATGRVVGAVGVGGARAVDRVRPLIARRAPCDELDSLPDAHLPEAAPQSGVRVRSA